MCLYKTHKAPKIAQNDIEVWKVLTPKGLSPYQGYQYHPGMNRPDCLKVLPVPAEQYEIYGGYLHAFRSLKRAEGCAAFKQELFTDYVVMRMLIPKGSMYYEGEGDDICAECLYWPPEEGTAHPNPVKIKEV